MTNLEKIKQMDSEELAEELACMICNSHNDCHSCKFKKFCDNSTSKAEGYGVMDWLKSDKEFPED